MKDIKTNYRKGRYSYPLCRGDFKPGWILKLAEFRETRDEFFERLANAGYKRISLYEVSTTVKGYHNLIAYVK